MAPMAYCFMLSQHVINIPPNWIFKMRSRLHKDIFKKLDWINSESTVISCHLRGLFVFKGHFFYGTDPQEIIGRACTVSFGRAIRHQDAVLQGVAATKKQF